tara:strand:+ start:7161 stop:7985 length:825 start_codon:yes stop_codon:yes gene_type:complete
MESIHCIICNSSKSSDYLGFQDTLNNDNIFNLVKCKCGLIFLNPRPDSVEISKYYNEAYLPHTNERKKMFDRVYAFIQKFTFKWKLKIIERYSGKFNSVLDIGGGSGTFCKYLQNKNKLATNYDPYYDKADSKDFNDNVDSYDLITLWHSLEHMHDIDSIFSDINLKLKENGLLYIAVPNYLAYERSYFGVSWAAYDIPRHLYHFKPETIAKLLNKYNFEIVNYHSMIQDTFFNIFLSKKSNILKKIYVLFVSILVIIFNKERSSSLLYICKKK